MPTKRYTNDDIIEHAKHVTSIAGLLRALGLREAGGNYIHLKRNLQLLNVNTDHWTGQAWSKDEQQKDYKDYTRVSALKRWLVKERGHKCEKCGLHEWQQKPLVLEIDHIDGNRANNDKNNLKLLCPNCHSQTSTWRGRKN